MKQLMIQLTLIWLENCTRIFLTPDPEDSPTSFYNGGYYILVYDMENEKIL